LGISGWRRTTYKNSRTAVHSTTREIPVILEGAGTTLDYLILMIPLLKGEASGSGGESPIVMLDLDTFDP
jgi:hypothetical protein